MNLNSNESGSIALILLILLINAIGLERLPKSVQSSISRVGRKVMRLRQNNPTIILESRLLMEESQQQIAVLDWLLRSEIALRSGG
jgi:hypothetical protein